MFLSSLTSLLCKLELLAARFCVAMILLLIVFNIVTRFLGIPFYWVDELAIYAMIWMIFISLPVLVSSRKNISVNIVTDILGGQYDKVIQLISDVIVFFACALVLTFTFNWFDPISMMEFKFNIVDFSSNTFNYIYQEPTNTLFFNKYIVWAIVPASFLVCSLHSGLNVIQSIFEFFPKRGVSL